MTETFDEAVEKLRRETRLSQQIEELAGFVDMARGNVPSLGYMFTGPQLAVLVDQLRELRGRRVGAGREPDDEVNAPADMCCCNVCLQGAPARQFRDGCPLHPAPHLMPGWQPDETPPKPECTGVSARWCPRHGDCTCTAEPWNEQDLNEPDCPLHGTASDHAEAPPDPEAVARRLLGELGPELAAAVCVQLLGRLPRRES